MYYWQAISIILEPKNDDEWMQPQRTYINISTDGGTRWLGLQ
jgi:hypothetical protein